MNTYDIDLVRTCYAYPEQYDALDKDGNCIAYLRLRHGSFTVDCPDAGRGCVYEVYQAEPKGDGIFEDDERELYLDAAKQAIVQYYNRTEYSVKHDFEIVVHMQPNPHDSPNNPYFWCIMKYVFNTGWCNSGSGWSATPEQAFSDAKNYFEKFIADDEVIERV